MIIEEQRDGLFWQDCRNNVNVIVLFCNNYGSLSKIV
jgi:hypothetical protein